jgi:hypothetical protein
MPDAKPTPDPSFEQLQRASEDLKKRIEEERKKNAMPVNSALGSTAIDAANADGHNDLKDDDDE